MGHMRRSFASQVILALLFSVSGIVRSSPGDESQADTPHEEQVFSTLRGKGIFCQRFKGRLWVAVGPANRWPTDISGKGLAPIDLSDLSLLKDSGDIYSLNIEWDQGFDPDDYRVLLELGSIRNLTIWRHRGSTGGIAGYLSKVKGLYRVILNIREVKPEDLSTLSQAESLRELRVSCLLSGKHFEVIGNDQSRISRLSMTGDKDFRPSFDDLIQLKEANALRQLSVNGDALSADDKSRLKTAMPQVVFSFSE